jgi:hypothetical protein
VSYGLLSITGNITNKWYQTRTPLSKLNLEEWTYGTKDMKTFESEAIAAAGEDLNYRKYNLMILVVHAQRGGLIYNYSRKRSCTIIRGDVEVACCTNR